MENKDIKIEEMQVNSYLTLSRLPDSDYVINPYIGCTHACKYCYASFMSRFYMHNEPWGTHMIIKRARDKISMKKVKNKRLFLGSVTDCYNALEEKECLTRGILEELVCAEARDIVVCTKSKLVLRDIDLIKQIKNIRVALSINTLDEDMKKDMDKASSIHERIEVLKTLHENGIKTICYVSPIFPGITDIRKIVRATKQYVDEFWFENLNLRGNFKPQIMKYVLRNYPEAYCLFDEIYSGGDVSYWKYLTREIEKCCKEENVKFKNCFDRIEESGKNRKH